MKKHLLLMLLLFSVAAFAFSETELGLAAGFGYDMAFGEFKVNINDINNTETFLPSSNIALSGFLFLNESKIGFFFHSALLGFPKSVFITKDGIKENKDFFITSIQSGFMLGPTFRINVIEKLVFQPGIGINFMAGSVYFSEFIPFYDKTVTFSIKNIDLGISGDIGLRFRLTNDILFSIGSILTFDFFRHIQIDASDARLSSFGTAKDFYQFRIRPYVSVGFNVFL